MHSVIELMLISDKWLVQLVTATHTLAATGLLIVGGKNTNIRLR